MRKQNKKIVDTENTLTARWKRIWGDEHKRRRDLEVQMSVIKSHKDVKHSMEI